MGSEIYCNEYLFDILFVLLRNKSRHDRLINLILINLLVIQYITSKLNLVPFSETNKTFLKLPRLLFFVQFEYKKCQNN